MTRKNVKCKLLQTQIKKLKTPFGKSKLLLMVLCGKKLKKVVFPADYYLHVFSKMRNITRKGYDAR